jgi:hypothetical protein
MDEGRGEYVCVPKKCEDRIAWENKSCSLKEDFLLFDKNSDILTFGCYYYNNGKNNDNNDKEDVKTGRCVKREDCPSDYPGVLIFIYI